MSLAAAAFIIMVSLLIDHGDHVEDGHHGYGGHDGDDGGDDGDADGYHRDDEVRIRCPAACHVVVDVVAADVVALVDVGIVPEEVAVVARAAVVGIVVFLVVVPGMAELGLVTLKETIRLMREIDRLIPSWPME